MEEIFEKKKKFTHIVIPTELANKLKNKHKGSYSSIIKQLLDISIETRVFDRIKQVESDILELQNKLERLVSFNRLRI